MIIFLSRRKIIWKFNFSPVQNKWNEFFSIIAKTEKEEVQIDWKIKCIGKEILHLVYEISSYTLLVEKVKHFSVRRRRSMIYLQYAESEMRSRALYSATVSIVLLWVRGSHRKLSKISFFFFCKLHQRGMNNARRHWNVTRKRAFIAVLKNSRYTVVCVESLTLNCHTAYEFARVQRHLAFHPSTKIWD